MRPLFVHGQQGFCGFSSNYRGVQILLGSRFVWSGRRAGAGVWGKVWGSVSGRAWGKGQGLGQGARLGTRTGVRAGTRTGIGLRTWVRGCDPLVNKVNQPVKSFIEEGISHGGNAYRIHYSSGMAVLRYSSLSRVSVYFPGHLPVKAAVDGVCDSAPEFPCGAYMLERGWEPGAL